MEPYNESDGRVEPTAGRLYGVTVDRAGERSPRGMMHRWIVRTSPTPSFQLERRTKGKEGSRVYYLENLYYTTELKIPVIQSTRILVGSFLSLYLDKRSRTRWVTTPRGTLDGVKTTPSRRSHSVPVETKG